ncbi:MAG: hypothetical protein JWM31_309 [Solirubrobacterales bacterium]|nr:hypothetical protein [Solirubrobacterales bacterium]
MTGPAADLEAVQEYLRFAAAHHREVVAVGPFRLHVDALSGSPGLNYAIPDARARPDAAAVEALLAAFTERELTPALEYLPALCPEAEAPLRAAGLRVEARIPVMTARPEDLRDVEPPGGVGVATVDTRTSDATLARVRAVQDAAFGAPVKVVEAGEIERLRRTARDGVVAFAYAAGEIIGGGVALVVHDGLTELAGIGVDAEHRGRGVAAALTAVLARTAVARGARLPFLTPADEAAGRVYARAGFATVGEMLHVRGAAMG